MVERPIKKSERQTVASPNDVVEEVLGTEPSDIEGSQGSINQSPEERSTTRPLRRKDKTKEKGKGNQQESEHSRQVNPALIRGPKPTKSKPPVIKQSQEATTEESVTEPSQETTAEG
jgi:hypothetical protein